MAQPPSRRWGRRPRARSGTLRRAAPRRPGAATASTVAGEAGRASRRCEPYCGARASGEDGTTARRITESGGAPPLQRPAAPPAPGPALRGRATGRRARGPIRPSARHGDQQADQHPARSRTRDVPPISRSCWSLTTSVPVPGPTGQRGQRAGAPGLPDQQPAVGLVEYIQQAAREHATRHGVAVLPPYAEARVRPAAEHLGGRPGAVGDEHVRRAAVAPHRRLAEHLRRAGRRNPLQLAAQTCPGARGVGIGCVQGGLVGRSSRAATARRRARARARCPPGRPAVEPPVACGPRAAGRCPAPRPRPSAPRSRSR
jgi:hypothetical protein